MNKSLFFSILTFAQSLSANMGPQGFSEYADNGVFFETGTFSGDGIQKALNAGFKEIYSIEIESVNFKNCLNRFATNENVHLFLGDSSKDLEQIIHTIDTPITFWLDGHMCPPREDGGSNCPLIAELEQISKHFIKTHTILIDDMHCADTILFDYLSKEDLIKKIFEINPNYEITFVPGGDDGEYPQNVMVAKVPNN